MKRSTRARALPQDAGRQLLQMAREAERHLALEAQVINALNVFPVPDGDTGTNMLATVSEALAQAVEPIASPVIAERLALGAMLGARGNSGVILSQLFRAQHETLRWRATEGPLLAAELAQTFSRARELSYAAVANPVEGTMLSVLSAAAAEARREAQDQPAGDILERVVAAAEAALAATPEQLPLLREAGVVDSGGYGLLLVLHGWYEVLCGRAAPPVGTGLLGLERARQQAASGGAHPADLLPKPARGLGYCVTLLVDAPNASETSARRQLSELGDSVLVVQADRRLKLHVHVPDPEPVLRLACDLGAISRSEISNLDQQASAAGASVPIVAVVPGEGLARLFGGLGATAIAGGQTQNPSTAELLAAAKPLPPPAFLLPNNGNVIPAARQAAASSDGLLVVPTVSVPQGVAAVLAYDAQATPHANLERMARAAEGVHTAELVTAARDATLQGIDIAPGQTMVLFDGQLVGVEDAGLTAMLERAHRLAPELATIYYGAAASQVEAARLGDAIRAGLGSVEVEIVRGDQPHAKFIVGFE